MNLLRQSVNIKDPKGEAFQSDLAASCLKNKAQLDVGRTNSLLAMLADSKVSYSISASELEELETHIKNNVNEFVKGDLAATIACFIKLGHMP